MKLCKRREFCLHSFLTLVWDGGELLPPCHGRLTPSKEPQYALHKRLGRPHSWFVQFHRREISLAPTEIWYPDCPASSLVTIPTVLPRHSYYCCSKHLNKSWNSLFAVTLPTIWSHLERLWFCACLTPTMGILCTHSEHILLSRSQIRNHVRQGMTPGKHK
jgi:hypothetical protein